MHPSEESAEVNPGSSIKSIETMDVDTSQLADEWSLIDSDVNHEHKEPKFGLGEKLLIRWKDSKYYATVIRKVKHLKNKDVIYNVHYLGWRNRYDELIEEDDLVSRSMDFTDENCQMLSDQNIYKPPTQVYKRERPIPAKVTRKRKASVNSSIRSLSRDMDPGPSRLNLGIQIHFSEKVNGFLSNDKLLTENHLFVKFPARVPIVEIIQQFCEAFPEGQEKELKLMWMKKIREYFDIVLGPRVLNSDEEQRHYLYLNEKFTDKDFEWSTFKLSHVYGFIHLLRAMKLLLDHLADEGFSPGLLQNFIANCNELVLFLDDRYEDFLNVTEDYERWEMKEDE